MVGQNEWLGPPYLALGRASALTAHYVPAPLAEMTRTALLL